MKHSCSGKRQGFRTGRIPVESGIAPVEFEPDGIVCSHVVCAGFVGFNFDVERHCSLKLAAGRSAVYTNPFEHV